MKRCTKCKQEKPLTEFYKHKAGKYGKDSQCKICSRAKVKKYRAEHKEQVKQYFREYKHSPRGREVSRRGDEKRRHTPARKIMLRKAYKKWEQSMKGQKYIRASVLKRRFGLTLEDYDKMFEVQSGCCAICNVHQSKLDLRLAVDHDHETGKIRGLVCRDCNFFLGHLEKNYSLLSRALEYLSNNNKF